MKNFEYKKHKYDQVTFKLIRITGTPEVSWDGQFAFCDVQDSFDSVNYLGIINVSLHWIVSSSPIPELYIKLESYLKEKGFEPKHDVVTVDNTKAKVTKPPKLVKESPVTKEVKTRKHKVMK